MTDPRPTPSAAAPEAPAGIAALLTSLEASQIAAAQPASWAPPGYDETDIGILEWIASHRRGGSRAKRTDLAA